MSQEEVSTGGDEPSSHPLLTALVDGPLVSSAMEIEWDAPPHIGLRAPASDTGPCYGRLDQGSRVDASLRRTNKKGLQLPTSLHDGHTLKFGIVYPNIEEYVDPELATRFASLADELGFEVLLTWDHYMYPDSDRAFDAWVLLAHVAAKTEKIRLGTCVTPIPFRSPAMLAKMVATLDVLSKGRVILGVGAGWHRPEFEGYSVWDDDGTAYRRRRKAWN